MEPSLSLGISGETPGPYLRRAPPSSATVRGGQKFEKWRESVAAGRCDRGDAAGGRGDPRCSNVRGLVARVCDGFVFFVLGLGFQLGLG
ncbi:hypothetical protein V6Z11_A12G156400 [Gossypium hirsutum]